MKTKKRILLVDDDIDILSVVETVLENEGHEVMTALNKEEGMAKAKARKPDLAILDVMMTTQFEGFELAEAFIHDEEFRGMYVLIQTSLEIFESNDDDVMKLARHYRETRVGKEMDVLLVQDYRSGKAGIDYRDAEGGIHWLPVHGFIRKPVTALTLISSIERLFDQDGCKRELKGSKSYSSL
jgi:CheY-like chemotaxis protein